jgi:hypothetical protein
MFLKPRIISNHTGISNEEVTYTVYSRYIRDDLGTTIVKIGNGLPLPALLGVLLLGRLPSFYFYLMRYMPYPKGFNCGTINPMYFEKY